MSVRRTVSLAVLAIVAIFAIALASDSWGRAPLESHDADSTALAEPESESVVSDPAERTRVEIDDPERTAAEPPVGFTSKLDEGEAPTAAPARDGIVVVTRYEDRRPCTAATVDVRWRKGFGLYGHDRGPADSTGRFATTVQSVDQIEGITVVVNRIEFDSYVDFLGSALDPREVHVVVPDLVRIRVRAQDLDRQPVEGANVRANIASSIVRPREYRLSRDESEAISDDDGIAELLVPTGACSVAARRVGYATLDMRAVEITRAGAELVAWLLDESKRREVSITVDAPPGVESFDEVSAFSRPIPAARASELGVESDGTQRAFRVERVDAGWIAHVDPLPWRVVVYADGCRPGIVDCTGDETSVHVTLQLADPPKPKAVLEVTVVDPFENPVNGAEVRLHDTPDLVYGASYQTNQEGRFDFECPVGGTVVISAAGRSRGTNWARALAGPFELLPETQRVRLVLREPLSVTGHVVDRDGTAVAARVELRRPAGVLAKLGDDVPAVLPNAPTSDWLGTGPEGTFAFDDLFPGEHELWAFPEKTGWPGRVRTMPGQDVTIVLGDGIEDLVRIDAQLRDATTGEPLAGRIWPLGDTDANGRVRTVQPPGRLELQAFAKEHVVTRLEPLELRPGLVPLDVRIDRSAPVFVRVLDSGGSPISRASVSVLDADLGEPRDLADAQGTWAGTTSWTGAAGDAELRGLPAGPLRLRIEVAGESREFEMPSHAGREGVFEVRFVD
ncbi:MAG: hypothetical protein KDB80_05785 [Planctomycetes bacterium]|nr:hypothetical protein [Planctomycetota bacterium]